MLILGICLFVVPFIILGIYNYYTDTLKSYLINLSIGIGVTSVLSGMWIITLWLML